MNAIVELHPHTLASMRGQFVRDLIENYGLTGNTVADRAGISRSTFASRLRGKTAFLADEIESIALPLRLDPVDFYAAYRSVTVGNPSGDRTLFIALDAPSTYELSTDAKKAPTREGEGQKLPGLDSNQEPIGFMPMRGQENVTRVEFGQPIRDVEPAPIVALGGAR